MKKSKRAKPQPKPKSECDKCGKDTPDAKFYRGIGSTLDVKPKPEEQKRLSTRTLRQWIGEWAYGEISMRKFSEKINKYFKESA